MQLFYNPNIKHQDKSFLFDKEESKHIIKVLRKFEGDTIYITDGNGHLFETIITSPSEKKCEVSLLSSTFFEPNTFKIHIAVAPTKMNDRLEWFLEKATEIGINEITPIICDRSERKNFNFERAEKIVIAAMKQSKQYYLPKINPQIEFSKFIQTQFGGQKLIAHCVEKEKKSLFEVVSKNDEILILIGPEGDFSEKEIENALKNSFVPITLGNTRLRTETAALIACHTVIVKNTK